MAAHSSIEPLQSRRVPRGAARRRQLAGVAEAVFLEFGYAETTMQMIATRAGASKETLYRHFLSKEGLFTEIVEVHAHRILSGCDGLTTDGAPHEVLRELGLSLFRSMNGHDGLCSFRIVVAEAQRTPELGTIFLDHGPGSIHRLVSGFLERATTRGLVVCPEPDLATRLFLGAVLGNYHTMRLVSPDAAPLSDDVTERHVEAAVAMFMQCYGTDDRRPRPHMLG